MLSVSPYDSSPFAKWQAQAGLNIQVETMQFTTIQMEKSRAGNHCRVIGTEFDGWITETNIEWAEFLLEASTQAGIGRYSTCQDDLLDVIFLCSQTGFDGQHFDN